MSYWTFVSCEYFKGSPIAMLWAFHSGPLALLKRAFGIVISVFLSSESMASG